MAEVGTLQVIDQDGVRAVLNLGERTQNAEGRVLLRLEDGQSVLVARELLQLQADGTYYLPLRLASLRSSAAQLNDAVVVPIIAEEVEVHKRDVERRRVRISKTVNERDVIVDQPLLQEQVDVNRVIVNRVVDEPPPVRYEGDTIILPVLEEVIVVEIRLMLREEVYITRRRTEIHDPQHVTLRREEIVIDTIEPGSTQGTNTERP